MVRRYLPNYITLPDPKKATHTEVAADSMRHAQVVLNRLPGLADFMYLLDTCNPQ